LFIGLLLIYTFKVIALSGLFYLSLIPISFVHYQKIKKQNNIGNNKDESEDLEDIL
jgi:CDP-diacylglycerol--serine O-phosphatidyltransferase